MSKRESRRGLAEALTAAAASYQLASVIPHCAQCARPCCWLDPLVLELDWRQTRALWQLQESRAAFDRRLSSGTGPQEIRAANGLYFAHGKVCPAYDETQRCCRIYGSDIKPVGCTDFPVYRNGAYIVADLRCEAVDLLALTRAMARSVGPSYRIVRSRDEEFPFLVSLSPRRKNGTPAGGGRSRRS